ncbi:hypothetical protein RBH20_18185 [Haloarcula sp. H-GB4]|uniref:hypothetical protein n=1 Tax=Haloarcula sp. H-GB4 TaxID=3069755 RepID=UPI0027B22240|nr:hypothetical protein [Haloarcula sp. H-GB4]MDQ2074464.1 hypothetical protein [Haloarcula sp. H-GB4]
MSYTDWVVQQGRYAGDEWLNKATGWHLDAAPTTSTRRLLANGPRSSQSDSRTSRSTRRKSNAERSGHTDGSSSTSTTI